jgi:hypothetical protein
VLLPDPFTTAAYPWVAIRGVKVSMAAKKYPTKVWRSCGKAVVLLHTRAASVALGSERHRCTKKHENWRRSKSRRPRDILAGSKKLLRI